MNNYDLLSLIDREDIYVIYGFMSWLSSAYIFALAAGWCASNAAMISVNGDANLNRCVCVFALHIAGQFHQIIVLEIFIGNLGAFLIWLCVVRIRDLYLDYPDCSPKMANMFVHRHVISEHVFVIWLMECKIANRPLKWRIWIMVSNHIQVVGKIRTN